MIEQAAGWAALLDDPLASETDRNACESWCDEHPLHRLAFDRIAGIGARFEALDTAQRRTLTASSLARRMPRGRIASGIASVLLLAAGAWIASTSIGVRAMWPDHSTTVGEQKSFALADGSELVADTDTRFDVFSAKGDREVTLFQGQVMATVAPDKSRPFSVRTREGTATALGTRYSVSASQGRTLVTVVESTVRLCPSAKGDCRTLSAGQRAFITADGVSAIDHVDTHAAALWAEGWIEVHDRPLSEVVGQLARYARGGIRYDAGELSRIRITGSYPLTRPEAALQSIAEIADVAVSRAPDGGLTIGLK